MVKPINHVKSYSLVMILGEEFFFIKAVLLKKDNEENRSY
jgi:hypothetical protein